MTADCCAQCRSIVAIMTKTTVAVLTVAIVLKRSLKSGGGLLTGGGLLKSTARKQ